MTSVPASVGPVLLAELAEGFHEFFPCLSMSYVVSVVGGSGALGMAVLVRGIRSWWGDFGALALVFRAEIYATVVWRRVSKKDSSGRSVNTYHNGHEPAMFRSHGSIQSGWKLWRQGSTRKSWPCSKSSWQTGQRT